MLLPAVFGELCSSGSAASAVIQPAAARAGSPGSSFTNGFVRPQELRTTDQG